jgi:hypothetical protein
MRCLMIYRPEANPETAPPPSPEHFAKMGAYIQEMQQAGVLLDTGGLAPSSRGARIRRRRGKLTVTDGPFTESKELIAGFAIMQLPSLAEAKQRAQRFLQLAGDGENEIRAMHEPSDWDPRLPKPALTRYMVIWRPAPDAEQGAAPSPEMLALIQEEQASGVLVASEGLEPSARGARVRRSKGKVTITDGPFTEAKELIAGYALVNVASLAEAKAHARSFLEIAGDGESEIRVAMEPPAAA